MYMYDLKYYICDKSLGMNCNSIWETQDFSRSIFFMSPTSRRAVGVQKHLFASELAVFKRATKTKSERPFVHRIIV